MLFLVFEYSWNLHLSTKLSVFIFQQMEWFEQLPKIELHAHLNGSLRDSTIIELLHASKNNSDISIDESVIELYKIGSDEQRSLSECFGLFDLIYKLTTTPDIIARITREVIEDFSKENVKYLELRTTPREIQGRMTKQSFVTTVLNTIEACQQEYDCIVGLILSINRTETLEQAMETVRLAVEFKEKGVIGIDLSGNPTKGQWDTFLPALNFARDHGLAITLHIGEVLNNEEVKKMLDYKPERIGHAIFLNDAHVQQLYSHPIPLELCLTSNIKTKSVTSYENHHFKEYYQKKIHDCLQTDDKGVFSTSLSKEFRIAATAFNMTKENIFELSYSAIDYIFAPQQTKNKLKELWQKRRSELGL